MIWKRTLLLVVLAITGLVLQTSAFGTATLDGSKPELLLLIVVAIAMSEGPEFGATAGFFLGLATDVLLGLPRGISPLVFTSVGYGAGRARAQMTAPTAWLPIVMSFGATLGGVLMYGGITILLGRHPGLGSILRHALLASAYNGLLTPFVFPLVRTLGQRLRPAGVATR